MADLRGGTTIGGFTALHSGLANAFLGGTLTVAGALTSGPLKIIQGGGNGLTIEDTDGTSGTRVWRFDGNANSLKLQALSDDANTWIRDIIMFGHSGNIGIGASPHATYKVDIAGDVQVQGWLRTTGAQGWYNQTYGGGWYMTDSTYIRNYGSKTTWLNAPLMVGTNAQTQTASGGLSIGDTTITYAPTTVNWTNGGTTLILNALDYSTIGFHDAGNRVDFIRVGGGAMILGYDGGWGAATVKIPGRLVIPVGTDMYATI